MCGRFVIIPDNLKARYDAWGNILELIPRYNVAPGQKSPVVYLNEEGKTIIESMKWGLIPHWAKDDSYASNMINARVETIVEKPTYRHEFSHTRCLVPISGYYEWKKINDKEKIPYYFFLEDEEIFSLAGLYSIWKDSSGNIVKTFSIITCEAATNIHDIHNRMPVILSKEDEKLWIDKEANKEDLIKLLTPYSGNLSKRTVSRLVNSPKNDNETLILEVKY